MEDDDEPLEQESKRNQDPPPVLLTAVGLELALGLAAILLSWAWGADPRERVPRIHEYGELARGIGFGILAAVPMLLLIQLVERLPIDSIRDLREETEERLLGMLSGFSVSELGLISLAAGVGEELLFRGWLMMSLAGPIEHWQTPTLVMAIVLSSIAFGLAHPITPAYVVVTAVIGVYLAMLLVWSGNLLVPIAAHAFYDFVQLVVATRAERSE
ncbi:CPBP family intramembrane glutamic endopeptidase [Candidatus Laterigemmans baculatus]|uniref:CPBP family intramembrane glutamic endopeptidase n=1 Tax=Candidatus Laterigemmans baculatus TaxID=2770505 RepID=UPI0013DD67EB|nr:CPBP family intramembrane glutamic endopeptidase [Candidatus Laterigemmans baculatus]